jgi:hypothetical protein
MIGRQALGSVLVVLVVVSSVAGVGVAGLAGASSSAPAGFVSVPDQATSNDVPTSQSLPGAAALTDSVAVNRSAETTSVSVTTEAAAQGVVSACTGIDQVEPAFCSEPRLVLNISDDQVHEGRKVAVPRQALVDAVGEVPETVYGTNDETGEQWTASTTVRDGYFIFEIPHFSTNTVTFAGEVHLSATPASDGESFDYDIADLDRTGNFTVDATGTINSHQETEETSNLAPNTNMDLSIAGNRDPTGPSANNQPVIEFTGEASAEQTFWSGSTDHSVDIYGTADGSAIESEWAVDVSNLDMITAIRYNTYSEEGNVEQPVDVYVVKGEGVDGTYGEGTLVNGSYDVSHVNGKSGDSVRFDQAIDVSTTDVITVEFVTHSGGSGNNYQRARVENSGTSRVSHDGSIRDDNGAVFAQSTPFGVTVSDDQGNSVALGDFANGETKTAELPLSVDSSSLSWSGSVDGGQGDVTLTFDERTVTEDIALEVNSGSTTYSGELAAGTTTSMSTDTAWLREGTNRLNVTVDSDGSLSADAPTPQVDVDYQHDADDLQNISFASEQWTERYKVSKTYASDRRNAYLNISHPSNVVSVRDLEVRWNESGGWSSIASSNYQLTGNDLSVDLSAIYPSGSTIPATSTVEVRLNASKVQPHNMTIEVLEASDANSELYSKIRFKSLGANAHLDVGPTDEGSRVHHLLDESWSAPSEYVVIDASGAQELHVPGATAGDTARVTNISTAVKVTDTTGDVQVGVESGGEEPTLDISPGPGGSGDSIELKYYRTTSGAEYALYSVTNGIIRDTDVAESPAILSDDDSNELLEITLESSGGSGGGSGGGGGAGQFVRRSTGGLPLGLIAVVGLLVVGVGFVVLRSSGRSSTSSRRGSGLTGRLSSGLSSWLSKPLTLAGLAAVALVGLVLTGALQVPSGTGVLLMVTGIPLVAYVALRSVGQYSTVAFGVVSLIAVVVGLQILGAEVVRALVEQLGPSIPLLALGGLYLAYKGVKAARAPEEKNEITLDVDGGDDGGGS